MCVGRFLFLREVPESGRKALISGRPRWCCHPSSWSSHPASLPPGCSLPPSTGLSAEPGTLSVQGPWPGSPARAWPGETRPLPQAPAPGAKGSTGSSVVPRPGRKTSRFKRRSRPRAQNMPTAFSLPDAPPLSSAANSAKIAESGKAPAGCVSLLETGSNSDESQGAGRAITHRSVNYPFT